MKISSLAVLIAVSETGCEGYHVDVGSWMGSGAYSTASWSVRLGRGASDLQTGVRVCYVRVVWLFGQVAAMRGDGIVGVMTWRSLGSVAPGVGRGGVR